MEEEGEWEGEEEGESGVADMEVAMEEGAGVLGEGEEEGAR